LAVGIPNTKKYIIGPIIGIKTTKPPNIFNGINSSDFMIFTNKINDINSETIIAINKLEFIIKPNAANRGSRNVAPIVLIWSDSDNTKGAE
jgi:hypothetical protein